MNAPQTGVIHTEQPPLRGRAFPANVTFTDLIRANKRRSAVLMVSMCALLVVLGAAIAAALNAYATGGSIPNLLPSVILGAVVAAFVGIIATLWSFYGGANTILSLAGAVEIPRELDPQLHNVVEELAIAAGIPKPRVFVINDSALNAFATGRDPEHAAVAITVGLRQQLSRDELAGVIAHEISHVRHYDIRYSMLMAVMVGLIVFASDAFRRILWYGGRGGAVGRGGSRRNGGGNGKGGNPATIIIVVVAIVLAIIAPILASLIRFAVSRQREYLADAGAVELTRYPQGLIGALEKLGSATTPLKNASEGTAHLYIVNPLKHAAGADAQAFSTAFRTHPPLNDRIERLRALIQ